MGTTTLTIVPATTETKTDATTTARKSRSDDGILFSGTLPSPLTKRL